MGETVYDLAVVGGGINGCGIARDAAGRGLSVFLCEKGDLAQATSSASTKLFHGGLRYLEHYEFRLVREALVERETLLRAMPHISWPLRFVLPHHAGLRPAWLLRLGLFIYDHLGGRRILPGTRSLDLTSDIAGKPLKDIYKRGFEYSDCWVQDSRLVVLNARDAAARGATIAVRTAMVTARREGGLWQVELEDALTGERRQIRARGLVNAGGPWVSEIIDDRLHLHAGDRIRLVGGSHIVVRRIHDHDRAYIFQNADNRIIFAIPYEQDFTLIGTTDRDHEGDPGEVACSAQEAAYLCAAASEYFSKPLSTSDIVWRYAGVRPLYDDGAKSATSATRDYVLRVNDEGGKAPLLNIFGGKITTYRRLAESALAKLQPYFPRMKAPWTAGVAMPGGDFPVDGVEDLKQQVRARYDFVDAAFADRLVRHFGTEAFDVLGTARRFEDLGRHFGFNLTEAEVRWMMQREWAWRAEDVVWRRTRLGLRLTKEEIENLDRWMMEQVVTVSAGQATDS
ncbi:MAG: glycerol-3-phosphate dehydrogenase [Geminicoccaceae bacterium]